MFGFGEKTVEVAIGQISGYFRPSAAERAAAYELFVELSTRTATLTDDDDLRPPRVILEDLDSLSGVTRQILRDNGADSAKGRSDGNVTLAVVALRVINEIIAPRTNRWLPLLDRYEVSDAASPEGEAEQQKPPAHQEKWDEDVCARDIDAMRGEVRTYMDTLARIAGAPALSDLVEPPPPSTPIPPTVLPKPLEPSAERNPRTSMVRWFDPIEGFRTLLADRVGKKDAAVRGSRTNGQARHLTVPESQLDESGDLWVDYVSDLGDAMDPTIAVAWQLTQPTIALPIDRAGTLPEPPPGLKRGALLIMGGDQVYPFAGAQLYEDKLVLPYELACLANPDAGDNERTIVAIPGNHDWYGGIEHFEKIFVEGDAFPEGASQWHAAQDERWWAIKLRDGWWIWGLDTALDDTLDAHQIEYFERVSLELDHGDQVIICTPVPLWQLRQKRTEKYFELRGLLHKLIDERGAHSPLFLAGDSHFFAHYRRVDGVATEHHITAGGGGAFLQPTHNLPEQVPFERGASEFKLGARWPRPVDSRSLAGDVSGLWDRQYWRLFPFVALLHLAFLALIQIPVDIGSPQDPEAGTWTLMWILARWAGWPVLALVVLVGIKSTAPNSREASLHKGAFRYGLLHGIALAVSVVLVATAARLVSLNPLWLLVITFAIGGIATTAVAVIFLGWINRRIKANDTAAYSSAHLTRYKHFVRMRFRSDGDLEIYVVGLDPVGEDWYSALVSSDRQAKQSRLAVPAMPWQRGRLIPPFDRAGIPNLHYVWGKYFRSASEHQIMERARDLGKDHPDTIFARGKQARKLLGDGDTAGSIELRRTNVASCLRTFGSDHDITLANRHGLALAYKAEGSAELKMAAVQERLEILEARVRVAEQNPVSVGRGTVPQHDGRAEAKRQRVLQAHIRFLSDVLPIWDTDLAEHVNDAAEASFEALDELRGSTDSISYLHDRLRARFLLAQFDLIDADDSAETATAEQAMEQLLTECEETIGAGDDMTLDVRSTLASQYKNRIDRDELTPGLSAGEVMKHQGAHKQRARALLEQNVEELTKRWGTQPHSATIAAQRELAHFQLMQGFKKDEIETRAEIVDGLEKLVGPADQQTIQARMRHAMAHGDVGQLRLLEPLVAHEGELVGSHGESVNIRWTVAKAHFFESARDATSGPEIVDQLVEIAGESNLRTELITLLDNYGARFHDTLARLLWDQYRSAEQGQDGQYFVDYLRVVRRRPNGRMAVHFDEMAIRTQDRLERALTENPRPPSLVALDSLQLARLRLTYAELLLDAQYIDRARALIDRAGADLPSDPEAHRIFGPLATELAASADAMSRCLALANESRNLGPDIDDHLAQWSAAIDDARQIVDTRQYWIEKDRLSTCLDRVERHTESLRVLEAILSALLELPASERFDFDIRMRIADLSLLTGDHDRAVALHEQLLDEATDTDGDHWHIRLDGSRTETPGTLLRARLAASYALADRWDEATSMCEEAKREAAATMPRGDPQRQWIAQLSEMIGDQDVSYARAARRPES